MKKMIVLIGIPGSGKSYLSNQIVERHGGNIVSSDAIRFELNGSEESQENPMLVWYTFYERAFLSLVEQDITILDATFARRRDRTKLFNVLPLGEVQVIGVHVNTSFAKASLQNSRRQRVVPGFVLESMYSALQEFPPSLAEGFSTLVEIKHPGDTCKLHNLLTSTSITQP